MEKSFSNQKELFMKLRPALRTKRHELIVNGKCELSTPQAAEALLELAPPSLKYYWWTK